MKTARAMAVFCVVCVAQIHAAESVNIMSQHSSVSTSVSLYRQTQEGFGELLLTRSERDDSPATGDRSASVEVSAAHEGVSQTSSSQLGIEITRQAEESTIHVASSLSTSFQPTPDARLRSGSTWIEIRSDQTFRVSLDRPHQFTASLVPTGNRSLAASGSVYVQSLASGENAVIGFSLTEAGLRTLSTRLGPGEHHISSSVEFSGSGSFDLDNGDIFPTDGDVGMDMAIRLVAIGETPTVSGRIQMLPPAAGRIHFLASELLPGKYYELERSVSLDTPFWQFVRNFHAASADVTFTDVFDPGAPAAFYRLRQSP